MNGLTAKHMKSVASCRLLIDLANDDSCRSRNVDKCNGESETSRNFMAKHKKEWESHICAMFMLLGKVFQRLRTENRLLRQRIDYLEAESAALADRLVKGQVNLAQEAENNIRLHFRNKSFAFDGIGLQVTNFYFSVTYFSDEFEWFHPKMNYWVYH